MSKNKTLFLIAIISTILNIAITISINNFLCNNEYTYLLDARIDAITNKGTATEIGRLILLEHIENLGVFSSTDENFIRYMELDAELNNGIWRVYRTIERNPDRDGLRLYVEISQKNGRILSVTVD